MRKVLFILSELADEDLDWLVENGVQEAHPSGTVLIREGQPIEVLYVILDGRASVTVAALAGEEVAVLQSGEVLGELSFLDSRPPSASVTALEEIRVLSVPKARLEQKLRQDPSFAARFYKALGVFLASRLRATQSRMGYGGDGSILDDDVEHEDELDPAVLENVAMAGARFDWMIKRLRGAASRSDGGGEG
jgi:bacteriocin-type transport-associated protein